MIRGMIFLMSTIVNIEGGCFGLAPRNDGACKLDGKWFFGIASPCFAGLAMTVHMSQLPKRFVRKYTKEYGHCEERSDEATPDSLK